MHVVLVGDECQLSAMVTSNVSAEWDFGRSLFGRLSLLGHPKMMLNIQYRMRPSIILFPNREFYENQIMNAKIVKGEGYQKSFLEGRMFGSYSFLNVTDEREEKGDYGHSWMNMVEMAVVVTLGKCFIKNGRKSIFAEWKKSKNKLTIAVVFPYVAQVLYIQDKIAWLEDRVLSIKVKTIDAFQGREAVIVILSTVQTSNRESAATSFISSPQKD